MGLFWLFGAIAHPEAGIGEFSAGEAYASAGNRARPRGRGTLPVSDQQPGQ